MTLDGLVPTTAQCPVVALEWDRGHESFDAIVRLDAPEAMVVTEVHDLWPLAGCLWVRRDEILAAELLPLDSPTVRVLDRLGVRLFGVEPALADLRTLLEAARQEHVLIAVHSTTTGSAEMLVGTVGSVSADRVELEEIDTAGVRTDEPLEYHIEEIIGVQWGTDYLRALTLLDDDRKG